MLEPTVHHQFLRSPIYTNNSEEADFFFVPHYSRMCSGINDMRWHELDAYLKSHGHFLQRYSSVDHFIMHSAPNYMDKPADRAIYYDKAPSIGILDYKNSQLKNSVWTASRSVLLPFITLPNTNYARTPAERDTPVYVAMSTSSTGLRSRAAQLRQKIEVLLDEVPGSKITVINRRDLKSFRSIIKTLPDGMGHSDYCIVPPGDAPSSKRFYDAIASLCVPLLVSDYFMFPFEGVPIEYEQAILQLPEKSIEELPQLLRMQTPAVTERKRQYLVELKRMFTWRYREPPRDGEALWMLSWALYDRHRMMEPYMNNEITGWDDDPPIPFSP